MLENIKTMILDFQETTLEIGIPRQLEIKVVPKKATICVGVRRSGKSTYMYQVIQRILSQGVSHENILYINFFDDRLHTFQHGHLNIILEAYFSLFPQKKGTEKIYCFFDEIQLVEQWESFIDRLMRTELCEVFLTGSSANMLSKELATQMRGRSLSWEIFPFSFLEFLSWKKIDFQHNSQALSAKKKLMIRKAFEEYWEYGGFPEVLGLEKPLRIKIHQEYFNTLLFRDLIERHDISHPKALLDLAYWLIDNISSSYSINSLMGYLKSLGHKITKSSISEYLAWFEDAYFFFTVRLHDASLARSHANPKKIYCIDHALVPSIASGILLNRGKLLENIVFNALRRRFQKINYYRTKHSREVDFIVQLENHSWQLIQVCESLVDPKTKAREITALQEAMKELHSATAILITREEEGEEVDDDGRKIAVMPAWRFVLT